MYPIAIAPTSPAKHSALVRTLNQQKTMSATINVPRISLGIKPRLISSQERVAATTMEYSGVMPLMPSIKLNTLMMPTPTIIAATAAIDQGVTPICSISNARAAKWVMSRGELGSGWMSLTKLTNDTSASPMKKNGEDTSPMSASESTARGTIMPPPFTVGLEWLLRCEGIDNMRSRWATAIKMYSKIMSNAASISEQELNFDMVRPGIIAYGYYPDEVTKEYLASKKISLELKPVMELVTTVCAIRPFEKGKSVGYGCTWTADKDTDIAVLPVGYYDGWFRRFSTSGVTVTINGESYPIRGRICMDQCMVELDKDHKVKRWDKVILFGAKENSALQSAGDIAALTGTIPYEITCGISKRVPRVYVE